MWASLDAASLLKVDTFSQVVTHPYFRVADEGRFSCSLRKDFARVLPSLPCPPCATHILVRAAYESDRRISSRAGPANPLSRAHNLAHSSLIVNRARVSWSVILSVCALQVVSSPGEGRKAWHDRRQGGAETLPLAQRQRSTSSLLSFGGPTSHILVSFSSDALAVIELCIGRLSPAYFIRGSTSAGPPPRGVSERGRVNLLIPSLI